MASNTSSVWASFAGFPMKRLVIFSEAVVRGPRHHGRRRCGRCPRCAAPCGRKGRRSGRSRRATHPAKRSSARFAGTAPRLARNAARTSFSGGLESDRLKASLESFREASKVELGGAEEGVAWLHPVKIREEHPSQFRRVARPGITAIPGPKIILGMAGDKVLLAAD